MRVLAIIDPVLLYGGFGINRPTEQAEKKMPGKLCRTLKIVFDSFRKSHCDFYGKTYIPYENESSPEESFASPMSELRLKFPPITADEADVADVIDLYGNLEISEEVPAAEEVSAREAHVPASVEGAGARGGLPVSMTPTHMFFYSRSAKADHEIASGSPVVAAMVSNLGIDTVVFVQGTPKVWLKKPTSLKDIVGIFSAFPAVFANCVMYKINVPANIIDDVGSDYKVPALKIVYATNEGFGQAGSAALPMSHSHIPTDGAFVPYVQLSMIPSDEPRPSDDIRNASAHIRGQAIQVRDADLPRENQGNLSNYVDVYDLPTFPILKNDLLLACSDTSKLALDHGLELIKVVTRVVNGLRLDQKISNIEDAMNVMTDVYFPRKEAGDDHGLGYNTIVVERCWETPEEICSAMLLSASLLSHYHSNPTGCGKLSANPRENSSFIYNHRYHEREATQTSPRIIAVDIFSAELAMIIYEDACNAMDALHKLR